MPRTPLLGSVVAKQRKTSATGPPVIQTLRPLSTQRSLLRSARVFMLKMSEPASGSLAPLAPKWRPSTSGGRNRFFWASSPNMRIGIVIVQSDAFSENKQPRIDAAVAEPFHRGDGRGDVLALSAVFGRDGQAGGAELRAPLIAFAPELPALVAGDGVGVDELLLGEGDGRVIPLLLLCRESEVHGSDLLIFVDRETFRLM